MKRAVPHGPADVTVGIITKNRHGRLMECLRSLAAQSAKVKEIVIVDSSSTYSNPDRNFLHGWIRYFNDPEMGLSRARNFILSKTRSRYLAFIDDDCIAQKDWISNLLSKTTKCHAAAVAGLTKTRNGKNAVALAARLNEIIWKYPGISGDTITDGEILDTKNLLISMDFVKKHRLGFDEKLCSSPADTVDDIDFGMALQAAGGKCAYCDTAIVYHDDATVLKIYAAKVLRDTRSYGKYERKWSVFRKNHVVRKSISTAESIGVLRNMYGLDERALVHVICIMYLTRLLTLYGQIINR